MSDGLSSAAIAANVGDVLPAIEQGLKSYGIDYGTPFFLKYGRVGAMDQVSEITGAEVTCVLIGERPGLITAESMSAYLAYKATVGMPEARRTVVSNIHKDGTIPTEAGAHIADIIKKILDAKASGTDLKLIIHERRVNKMKRDPITVERCVTKLIPNVSPGMAKELNLKPEQRSLALITADCDDVTYTALDEATKKADVQVVYAKSFYGGAANANTKLAGEIIGILAGRIPLR